MKTKQIIAVLTVLFTLLFASMSRAASMTATNSGNWGTTNIWDSGTVPGANDVVFIAAGVNVTVNTNASAQSISDDTTGGKVTMGPNSALTIFGNDATHQLTTLDTTAAGNTVIYAGNPFFAKQCNYYNLVFSNTNYADPFPPYSPYQNFNNFSSSQGPTPMTIARDMTLLGHTKAQQGSGGAPITINGNLIIGPGCAWDSSGDILTVVSNLYVYGLLEDLNGALGTNYCGGNVIVAGPSTSGLAYPGGPYTNGWYVSDVVAWGIGGNLTNNGSIFGSGYGSISFDGTGIIAGSNALTIPTITVNGAYTIGTTITLITNTPTLNGTLVFDLARTNQIVLQTNAGTALYYDGALNVINSGPPPASGNSFQLFNAPSYGGAFIAESFPPLPGGLSWVDDLAGSGSISVTGTATGPPVITAAQYNPASHQFTLTWSSVPAVTYSVLLSTNLASGGFTNVLATGIPSGGASTTNTVTVPNGNAGFIRIRQP